MIWKPIAAMIARFALSDQGVQAIDDQTEYRRSVELEKRETDRHGNTRLRQDTRPRAAGFLPATAPGKIVARMPVG